MESDKLRRRAEEIEVEDLFEDEDEIYEHEGRHIAKKVVSVVSKDVKKALFKSPASFSATISVIIFLMLSLFGLHIPFLGIVLMAVVVYILKTAYDSRKYKKNHPDEELDFEEEEIDSGNKTESQIEIERMFR